MIGIVADKIVSVTEIPEIVRAIAQFYMRIVIQGIEAGHTYGGQTIFAVDLFQRFVPRHVGCEHNGCGSRNRQRQRKPGRVGQFKTLKIGDRCFSITVFQAHQ